MTEQEEVRRAHLDALRARGVEPFPAAEWGATHRSAAVLEQYSDEANAPEGEGTAPLKVRMAGRMGPQRVMGKAAFFHLSDESGRIQVYVRRDDIGSEEYNEVFKRLLDAGDWVGVEGEVFRTKMGEISVRAERLVVLSKSLRPLPVEKEAGGHVYNEVTDSELRYRQRYVDLALHPDVRDVFIERARMVTEIRRFLDARGYIEVETPALQPIYGGAAARPFRTHHNALDLPLYLRIADELYLKRLLVGGLEGVYEIAKDFRNEGLSRFHNPEFTMLELYVAFRDYGWMMELVEELLEAVAVALHGMPEAVAVKAEGERRRISFRAPYPRRGFFDLIRERTGREFRGLDRDAAAAEAGAVGVDVAPEWGLGKVLDEVFGELVEPTLVQPTFVIDYPVALSPLAKRHREHDDLVERFELICNGKELCNAFSELNDPIEQRARFEEQVRLAEAGDQEYGREIDEDYIRALEYGMPPAAGMGMGIDRLAMLMTGQASIRDVLLFPLLRPESADAPPSAAPPGGLEVYMGVSARPAAQPPTVDAPADDEARPAPRTEPPPPPPPGGMSIQFGVRARPDNDHPSEPGNRA